MNADGSEAEPHAEPGDGRPSFLVPDGRRIAFVSNRDGRPEAHVMNAGGSGQRSLTLRDS
jgi:Tol biopolymer transport system component